MNKFSLLISLLLVFAAVFSEPASSNAVEKSGDVYKALKKINSRKDFDQWLLMYFEHPQPELTAQALLFSEKKGDFDNKEQEPVLFAIASRQFAQNPEKISAWLEELAGLKLAHKVLIWKALWSADTDDARAAANKLAQQFPESNRPQELTASSKKTTPIISMELNPGVLEMLWTSYFITGNSNYVARICEALPVLAKDKPDVNRIVTAGAAQWSLVDNGKKYGKIVDICQQTKVNKPELTLQIDKVLEAVKKPDVEPNDREK